MAAMGDFDPFTGDARIFRLEQLGEVKGALFRTRPMYVAERWGLSGLEELGSMLSPDLRALLDNPPPTSGWVDYRSMIAVDRVIYDVLMQGDVEQMFEFGARNARFDLERTYAHLLRIITSLRFFIRRAGTVYRTYFRSQAMFEAMEDGLGIGKIKYVGPPHPRYMCRYGVSGWLHEMMRFYGVEPIESAHTQCLHDGDEACSWTMRWH